MKYYVPHNNQSMPQELIRANTINDTKNLNHRQEMQNDHWSELISDYFTIIGNCSNQSDNDDLKRALK